MEREIYGLHEEIETELGRHFPDFQFSRRGMQGHLYYQCH